MTDVNQPQWRRLHDSPLASRCYECGGLVASLLVPYLCDVCSGSEPGLEEVEMKVGSMFPGNFLKAADLQGRRVVVEIDRVSEEDLGSEKKPVLWFIGKDRGLVLNKTNANAIQDILGTDETDDWHGQRVVLHPAKTDFQGKRVDCIRVDAAPANGQKAKPAQQPEPEELGEDEVPF